MCYRFLLTTIVLHVLSATGGANAQDRAIMNGARLVDGHDMVVWDSENDNSWLSTIDARHVAAYPGYSWGGISVMFGNRNADPRPLVDLSDYSGLSVELRGATGGEQVDVRLKDADNSPGNEESWSFRLTTETKRYHVEFSGRARLNLRQVELPFILVFEGGPARTVEFSNIALKRND